jgi:hypothetical protein
MSRKSDVLMGLALAAIAAVLIHGPLASEARLLESHELSRVLLDSALLSAIA